MGVFAYDTRSAFWRNGEYEYVFTNNGMMEVFFPVATKKRCLYLKEYKRVVSRYSYKRYSY